MYLIVLAAAEIEIYGRIPRRRPPLDLPDWADVETEARAAQHATSYFWFLSGEPEDLDRINTVHSPPGNMKPKWGPPVADPATIQTRGVRYYRDPLDREYQRW